MKRTLIFAWLFSLAIAGAASTFAADRVVATFKPVHSLVSAVMGGVGEPYLIMRSATSPHTYRMRPSDARVIGKARVIFMIGETVESTLAGPVQKLAGKTRVVELVEVPGLVRLPLREGGGFEAGDQGHGHGHGHAHEGAAFDRRVWLDPVNAGLMALVIARELSDVDPGNAARYKANADAVITGLDDLIVKLDMELEPVRDKPFIVFRDASQYFEKRFGLKAVGAAVVSTSRAAGIRRVRDLRKKVRELGVVCVFAEPRYDPRLVRLITEGSKARGGTLDPAGITIKPGPGMYSLLMRGMAASFRECLAPSG